MSNGGRLQSCKKHYLCPMNIMLIMIFLLLPLLGCGFVAWHVWVMLPFANLYKGVVLAVMLLAFLCVFFNFWVGLDRLPTSVATICYEVGYSSVFVLLYLVLIFLLLNVLRWVGWLPDSWFYASPKGSMLVFLTMCGIFVYGNLHYYNKVRMPLELKADKLLPRPVKLVMLSDLHLGYHNTRADLAQWVDLMNVEKPDAILIGGDIVDFSVVPLIRADMAAEFRRLNVPVYACLGNHDYYAGEPNSERFYKEAGIILLRDSVAELANGIVIVGRDDRTNKRRKSVERLMSQVDRSKYVILLDHQPYHLEEAERCGVDFQFSGHTHYGQVWPISWIENMIYEDAYGPLTKGRTQYYVSSGIGIWGGKFRIGTQSEYIVATIR